MLNFHTSLLFNGRHAAIDKNITTKLQFSSFTLSLSFLHSTLNLCYQQPLLLPCLTVVRLSLPHPDFAQIRNHPNRRETSTSHDNEF